MAVTSDQIAFYRYGLQPSIWSAATRCGSFGRLSITPAPRRMWPGLSTSDAFMVEEFKAGPPRAHATRQGFVSVPARKHDSVKRLASSSSFFDRIIGNGTGPKRGPARPRYFRRWMVPVRFDDPLPRFLVRFGRRGKLPGSAGTKPPVAGRRFDRFDHRSRSLLVVTDGDGGRRGFWAGSSPPTAEVTAERDRPLSLVRVPVGTCNNDR